MKRLPHPSKIEIDIDNGTYDVYIDNACVRPGVTFTATGGLNRICFGVGHADKNESVAAYIDNVKVYAATK